MKIALVAGESSGDLLGAGLIREIRRRVPNALIEGVAGPAMRDAGCEVLEDAEALAVMGLIEPLAEIPRLLKLRRTLRQRWIADPPDVFVGIDAPDFNLGLEASLRAAGVRTAHYVSPTVWAWRRRRVHKVRKAADLVLCILPFEKAFLDENGVNAVFVGHPKADSAPVEIDAGAARARLGLDAGDTVVAVLPGSRSAEVERLGPLFAAAARRVAEQHAGARFVTPAATPRLRDLIEQQLEEAGIAEAFLVLDGDAETAMTAADVVLLASGTAALESALLTKPTVAAYRVAPLTAAIVRGLGLLKVDRVTLPNLLTNDDYVPEFIQEEVTPGNLADAVNALLDDPERRAAIARRFATLRSELAQGADQRAAEAVLALSGFHEHAATKTVQS